MKALQVFVEFQGVVVNINNKNKGFSLIELLVVMFIIGILTSVLLPNLMSARQRAKDAQRIEDMNSIKNALRLYYNDYQIYPTPASAPNMVGSGLSPYLPGIDKMGVGYTYTYATRNNGDSFTLLLTLESAAGDEDVRSQARCGESSPIDGLFAVCAN